MVLEKTGICVCAVSLSCNSCRTPFATIVFGAVRQGRYKLDSKRKVPPSLNLLVTKSWSLFGLSRGIQHTAGLAIMREKRC